jgi:hypothetical protein
MVVSSAAVGRNLERHRAAFCSFSDDPRDVRLTQPTSCLQWMSSAILRPISCAAIVEKL